MKRIMSISVFLALSLLSANSRAEMQTNEERFVSERLWHFAELPAWFLVWDTFHEGSHALTATALGYENCVIHPYPHEHNGVFSYGDSFCDNWRNFKSNDAIIFIIPSILDVAVFTASDFLLTRRVIEPDSLAGGLLFFGGMVAPWLDLTLNTNSFNEYADNAVFARLIGIPRWSVMVIQDIVAVAGFFRIISTFQEIFFEDTETDNLTVTILPSPNKFGLQVAGRF